VGEKTEPGTANTSRPKSAASLAVMSMTPRGLDDDDAGGETRDDAIADRILRARLGPRRVLDEQVIGRQASLRRAARKSTSTPQPRTAIVPPV
jgi:hypothetical protein